MSERLEPLVADVVRTRSGGEAVTIRAIRPDDGVRIVRAFQALEPRSIYLRFFSPKKELSAEEVRRVSEPDPAREAALVATVATGDQEEIIVGLGEYVGSGASADMSPSPSRRTIRAAGSQAGCSSTSRALRERRGFPGSRRTCSPGTRPC